MQICIHEKGKYTIQEKPEKLQPYFVTDPEITNATKPHNLSISKRIWSEKTIFWKLQTDYTHLERKLQEKAVKLAVLELSVETPLVIRQRNRDSGDAHIVINFFDSKTETTFKDHPSYLAFAYGPAPGIGGDVTFNADQIWTLDGKPMTVVDAFEKGIIKQFQDPTNKLRTYDVEHTGKHEILHAFGCPHIDTCKSCIMYPFYNGERALQENDKDLLHQFYGRSSVNHKIKEYLLSRIRKGVMV